MKKLLYSWKKFSIAGGFLLGVGLMLLYVAQNTSLFKAAITEDAVCGPADGQGYTQEPPAVDLCDVGASSNVTYSSSSWSWTCQAGTTVSCEAYTMSPAINGQCGSAHDHTYSTNLSGDSPNLCSVGTVDDFIVTTSGWEWTCAGIDGGDNPACWAFTDDPAACGSAEDTPSLTKPNADLCNVGAPSAVEPIPNQGYWGWTCQGHGAMFNWDYCSAPFADASLCADCASTTCDPTEIGTMCDQACYENDDGFKTCAFTNNGCYATAACELACVNNSDCSPICVGDNLCTQVCSGSNECQASSNCEYSEVCAGSDETGLTIVLKPNKAIIQIGEKVTISAIAKNLPTSGGDFVIMKESYDANLLSVDQAKFPSGCTHEVIADIGVIHCQWAPRSGVSELIFSIEATGLQYGTAKSTAEITHLSDSDTDDKTVQIAVGAIPNNMQTVGTGFGNETIHSSGVTGAFSFKLGVAGAGGSDDAECLEFNPSKTSYTTAETPSFIYTTNSATDHVILQGTNAPTASLPKDGTVNLTGPLTTIGNYNYNLLPYNAANVAGTSCTKTIPVTAPTTCTYPSPAGCPTFMCKGKESCPPACVDSACQASSSGCSYVKNQCGAQCATNADCGSECVGTLMCDFACNSGVCEATSSCQADESCGSECESDSDCTGTQCFGGQVCNLKCNDATGQCVVNEAACNSIGGQCGTECAAQADCPIYSCNTQTKQKCDYDCMDNTCTVSTRCFFEIGICGYYPGLTLSPPIQNVLTGQIPSPIRITGGLCPYSVEIFKEYDGAGNESPGATGLAPTLAWEPGADCDGDESTRDLTMITFLTPATGEGSIILRVTDSQLPDPAEAFTTIVVDVMPNLAMIDGFYVKSLCDHRMKTEGDPVIVGEICTLIAYVVYDNDDNGTIDQERDVSRWVYWEGFEEVGVFVDGDTLGRPNGKSDLFVIPRALSADPVTDAEITALLLLAGDIDDPDPVTIRGYTTNIPDGVSGDPIEFDIVDPGRLMSIDIESECDSYDAPGDTSLFKKVGEFCTLHAIGTFEDSTEHDISNIVSWLGVENVNPAGTEAAPPDPKNAILEITKRGIATITALLEYTIYGTPTPDLTVPPGGSMADAMKILYNIRGDGVSSAETDDPIRIRAVDPERLVSMTLSSDCDDSVYPTPKIIGDYCTFTITGTFEDGHEADITSSTDLVWHGYESLGAVPVNGTFLISKTNPSANETVANIFVTRAMSLGSAGGTGGGAGSGEGDVSSNTLRITATNPGRLTSITISSPCNESVTPAVFIGDVCALTATGIFADGRLFDISRQVTWNGIGAVTDSYTAPSGTTPGDREIVIEKEGRATITATRLAETGDLSGGEIVSYPPPIIINAVDPDRVISLSIDSVCNNNMPPNPTQRKNPPVHVTIGDLCQLRATATFADDRTADVTNSENLEWDGYQEIGEIDSSNNDLLTITARRDIPETAATITAVYRQSKTNPEWDDIVSDPPPILIIVVEKAPMINEIYTIGNAGIAMGTTETLYVDLWSEEGIESFDNLRAWLVEGWYENPEDIPDTAQRFQIVQNVPLPPATGSATAGEGISILLELPIFVPVFADFDKGPATWLVEIRTDSNTLVSGVDYAFHGTPPNGDADRNGRLDLTDIILMLKAVNGEITFTSEQLAKTDFNWNFRTDLIDVINALRTLFAGN